jgi:hypothetical protein
MRYTASTLEGSELILVHEPAVLIEVSVVQTRFSRLTPNCRDKHEHNCFLLTAPISSVVIILEFRLKLDELLDLTRRRMYDVTLKQVNNSSPIAF